MFEYDIYFPLFDNEGISHPEETLSSIKRRLVDFFGGLTDLKHQSEGVWRIGNATFHDAIVILRVLGDGSPETRAFLGKLKSEMASKLRQKEILILQKSVTVI